MNTKVVKSAQRKVYQIFGIIFSMSNMVHAHFSGPPLFLATDEEFALVSSVCNSSLARSDQDSVFGFHPDTFFYLSGERFKEFDGKKYYETYFINTSGPTECLGLFHTHGLPTYGSVLKTAASSNSETVVLDVPDGKIEVTYNGNVHQIRKVYQ